MDPGKLFQLLIIKFANQFQQTLNCQVVALVLINHKRFIRSTLPAREVLGVMYKPLATSRDNNELLKLSDVLFSVAQEKTAKDSLATLKIDYLPTENLQSVCQMNS